MDIALKTKPALEGGKPTRKKFLIFGKPQIKKAEIDEVIKTLKSGWLSTGPRTAQLEEELSEYLNVKHAIALNSCTAGLHLALLACGVGPGDEVITTPMTFGASANVIEHVGATPVFVDIDKITQNIDPSKIEAKITKKTKAIIPVHMTGRPCEMDKIMAIARKYKLKVIEDAAHAIGASYQGKKIGTIGDVTVFSFYVTKNLITGEGGMVTTNNKKIADFIRLYSLHGMDKGAWKRYSAQKFKHYLIKAPGYKYNMMDLQAALGLHQSKRFEINQKRRKSIWSKYNKGFQSMPLITPADPAVNSEHAYHLYTILVDLERLKVDRNTLNLALQAENIGVGTHFIALHLHPFYANKYQYKRGDFPNAEFVSDRTISLPFSAALSDADVADVINGVKKVLSYYQKNIPRPKEKTVPDLKEILNN